jgi:hypothetical protein
MVLPVHAGNPIGIFWRRIAHSAARHAVSVLAASGGRRRALGVVDDGAEDDPRLRGRDLRVWREVYMGVPGGVFMFRCAWRCERRCGWSFDWKCEGRCDGSVNGSVNGGVNGGVNGRVDGGVNGGVW